MYLVHRLHVDYSLWHVEPHITGIFLVHHRADKRYSRRATTDPRNEAFQTSCDQGHACLSSFPAGLFAPVAAVCKSLKQNSSLVEVPWLAMILMITGLVASLSAFLMLKSELDSRQSLEFHWVAHNRNNALKKGIEDGLEADRKSVV